MKAKDYIDLIITESNLYEAFHKHKKCSACGAIDVPLYRKVLNTSNTDMDENLLCTKCKKEEKKELELLWKKRQLDNPPRRSNIGSGRQPPIGGSDTENAEALHDSPFGIFFKNN